MGVELMWSGAFLEFLSQAFTFCTGIVYDFFFFLFFVPHLNNTLHTLVVYIY